MPEYTEKQKEQRRKAVARQLPVSARNKRKNKRAYRKKLQRIYKRSSCKRIG